MHDVARLDTEYGAWRRVRYFRRAHSHVDIRMQAADARRQYDDAARVNAAFHSCCAIAPPPRHAASARGGDIAIQRPVAPLAIAMNFRYYSHAGHASQAPNARIFRQRAIHDDDSALFQVACL